jgi:hypothetical protein
MKPLQCSEGERLQGVESKGGEVDDRLRREDHLVTTRTMPPKITS